jgi:hypothetical protein
MRVNLRAALRRRKRLASVQGFLRGRDAMENCEIVFELRKITNEVRALRDELERYKGFVGGVAWCLSALTALVGFVWGTLNGVH